MSRARFGIDVDGVMYHFQKTALYMLNTMKGYDLKLEDWTYWNQPKDVVKNNDWQWLWSGGVKDGLFRYGHLYKGTIEAMRALNVLGDVVIITHRPRHARLDTYDWLAYQRLPISEVHVLSDGQPKSIVPACDLYVDDKPENIIDFQRNTTGLPLLWLRPWNGEWVEGYSTGNLTIGDADDVVDGKVVPATKPTPVIQSWQEVIDYAQQVVAERIVSDVRNEG